MTATKVSLDFHPLLVPLPANPDAIVECNKAHIFSRTDRDYVRLILAEDVSDAGIR